MRMADEYQMRLAGIISEEDTKMLPVGTPVEVRDTMRKGLSKWHGTKGYVAAHVNVEGEDMIIVRSEMAYKFQQADLMIAHPEYVFRIDSDSSSTP